MDDVLVLGVGADGAYAHLEYAAAHNLQFPLLSDSDSRVSQAYGVLQEEFEGHREVPSRATFVVHPDRTVEFAQAARSPDEQPDLDALRRATNAGGDRRPIDDVDESS